MANKTQKMARLRAITDAAQQLREAKIGVLRSQQGELTGQISQLDEALKTREHEIGSDAARQAGADLKWQRWVDGRKIAVNQSLATIAHQIALERDALRLEFGRAQAAQKLEKRAKKEAAIAREKRAQTD